MSLEEKRAYLQELLGADYDLRGENFVVLSAVMDYIGYADNAFSLTSLIPQVSSIIGRSAILAIGAEGVSIASIVLFPVGAMIQIINALQSGQRMYGMRAVAYTTTAFAFGDPSPNGSPRIINNMKTPPYVAKPREFAEHATAWAKASKATLENFDRDMARLKVDKKALQVTLRALGGGERQKLCLSLLKGFEKDYDAVTRGIWKSGYSIVYPQ